MISWHGIAKILILKYSSPPGCTVTRKFDCNMNYITASVLCSKYTVKLFNYSMVKHITVAAANNSFFNTD